MKSRISKADHVFKVIVVGDAGVGKTSIISKYTMNMFQETVTIGIDFKVKDLDINKMKVKLQIWDTVGSEKFRSITSSYFKNTHAVILVYSTKESFFQILPCFICSFPNHLEFKYFTGYCKRENSCFDNLDKWIRAIEENASENIMVVLSAAKCDLENREVTKEQGKEKAEEMGFQFYETSSRENMNITEMFYEIAKQLCYPDLKITKGLELDELKQSIKLNKQEEQINEKSCQC